MSESHSNPVPSPTAANLESLGFGCGPLRTIDPQLLLTGDDDVDGFALALAIAYNDLKAIHWMNYLLIKHRPTELTEISGDVGQWHGMRVQTARWLMALAHEIIHAIAKADESGVLKRAHVRKVVKSLPDSYQTVWKELVSIATNSSRSRTKFRRYLRDLRNDNVFHFAHWDRIVPAYRAYFITDERNDRNTLAYYSTGPTLKETRFYFADAASQRMFSGDEELQRHFDIAEEFLEDLHHALGGFVIGFIRRREASTVIRKKEEKP